MYQKIKSELQIAIVLLLSIVALAGLSLVVGGNVSADYAAAQVFATSTPPSRMPLTDETLAAFGLATDTIHAANVPTFDIAVTKSRLSPALVNSGDTVSYSITLHNQGVNPATGVIFYDAIPNEFENVSYAFSTTAISNGATIPSDVMWLLVNPIGAGDQEVVTVTAKVVSFRDATVVNTAMITSYNPYADTGGSNNRSSASVSVAGDPSAAAPLFFPVIARFPTPTPSPTPVRQQIYFEDFDGTPWLEFGDDNSDCRVDHRDNQFWVDVMADEKCLPPARDQNGSYRTYGEFEVEAYHSEGQSDAGYGLYINGEGGDNYYYFIIWPNNNCSSGGGWELIRRKNDNEVRLLGSKNNCNTDIRRGFGSGSTNRLRITHKNDRTLAVYANDALLGSFQDNSSDHRTGEGNGLYVRADDRDVRIKYDNWTVYRYP